jgi:hypothetical protein
MFASRNPHAFKVHQPDKENMITSQASTGPFKTPMAQRTLHPSKGMHTVGPKRMQTDIKDGSKTEFKSRIAPSLNRNGGNMASPFLGNGKGKEVDNGKPMMGGSECRASAPTNDLELTTQRTSPSHLSPNPFQIYHAQNPWPQTAKPPPTCRNSYDHLYSSPLCHSSTTTIPIFFLWISQHTRSNACENPLRPTGW